MACTSSCADAQLTLQVGNGLLIIFQEKAVDGSVKSCQLHLDASLVHGLVHLIGHALLKADWDTTNAAPPEIEPPASAVQDLPRYTH